MTVEELAAHAHGQNINGNGNDGWNNFYGEMVTLPDNGKGKGQDGYAAYQQGNSWVLGGNRVYTSKTGGDKPHNNMEPYKVIYVFMRSA